MTELLTAQQRATVAIVSAWFMPPDQDLIPTQQADPDDSVLDLVLEQLSPALPEIRQALDGATGVDVPSHLARLEADRSPAFEHLRVLVIGRYLTCRPVWARLGYTGREPAPVLPGEAEHDLRGGLLDQVLLRGKIYREV